MSIRNSQAFPSATATDAVNGMTYRQWLIGMALSGESVHEHDTSSNVVASNAIASADAIIFRLDAEAERR